MSLPSIGGISSVSYPSKSEESPHLAIEAGVAKDKVVRERDEALRRLKKNPDPSNWEIIRREQVVDYFVVMIRYPNEE